MVTKIPKKASPTSAVVPADAPQTPKDHAEVAVRQYEEKAKEYYAEREQFEQSYPEALVELQRIGEIKEDVLESIEKAKILVRDAGVSIGDFRVQTKFTQAGYDASKMTELLIALPPKEMAAVIKSMVEKGVMTSIVINRDAIKVAFPHDPAMSAVFEKAYDEGGEPLTPAVYTPKLT